MHCCTFALLHCHIVPLFNVCIVAMLHCSMLAFVCYVVTLFHVCIYTLLHSSMFAFMHCCIIQTLRAYIAAPFPLCIYALLRRSNLKPLHRFQELKYGCGCSASANSAVSNAEMWLWLQRGGEFCCFKCGNVAVAAARWRILQFHDQNRKVVFSEFASAP